MNHTATSKQAGRPARKRIFRLVDTLNFTPVLPEHSTQPARLLHSITGGKSIGPWESLNELGIYRLSDSVFQLRESGWPVITNRVDVTNQFGGTRHVASYKFAEWCIDRVGKAGRTFAAHEMRLMDEERTDR